MKTKTKTKTKIAPSSNWKKLLPTIKATQTTATKKTNSKKRKATNEKETESNKKKRTDKEQKKSINIPKKEELWFDIDEKDLETAYGKKLSAKEEKIEEKKRKADLIKSMNELKGNDAKLGKFVAIDCEMVGVGPEGIESALARVSLVNYHGAVLLDLFVKPQEKVTDYRTAVSGITRSSLKNASTFKEAQKKVAEIIKDRILIGHAVENDLQALMLDHPKLLIRDTSRYKPFRKISKGRTPGLKMLVKELLHITIQSGSHSSVEDARFTMSIYKSVKTDWEKQFGSIHGLQMKKLKMRTESKKNKNTVAIETAQKKNDKNHPQQDDDSDSDSSSDSDDDDDDESD
ncbi:unnamed protein product [Cunninghamella blakesleeana]